MHRPVLITDCDELIDTEAGDLVMGCKRIVPDSPPGIGIENPGKQIHNRVKIR